jgi:SAM-dependent methyltransferase
MSYIVDYAKLTTQDRNPVKRWLQNLRLNHSLRGLKKTGPDFNGNVLDFGAGNGELIKRLAGRFPDAQFFCYEPTEGYRKQAAENLKSVKYVQFPGQTESLPAGSMDLVFCMEVFEHLPDAVIQTALREIDRLLKKDGAAVIGVPVEIHLAALWKGLFRITRRYGETDARLGNILRAIFGHPPRNRDIVQLESGVPYIIRHLGFDYRQLRKELAARFEIRNRFGSPFPYLPVFLNFEVYYVCHPVEKAENTTL